MGTDEVGRALSTSLTSSERETLDGMILARRIEVLGKHGVSAPVDTAALNVAATADVATTAPRVTSSEGVAATAGSALGAFADELWATALSWRSHRPDISR